MLAVVKVPVRPLNLPDLEAALCPVPGAIRTVQTADPFADGRTDKGRRQENMTNMGDVDPASAILSRSGLSRAHPFCRRRRTTECFKTYCVPLAERWSPMNGFAQSTRFGTTLPVIRTDFKTSCMAMAQCSGPWRVRNLSLSNKAG